MKNIMLCDVDHLNREQKRRSKLIEIELERAKRYARREIKLLLLGTGESGKSTFVKQMRIIHNSDHFDNERQTYTQYVYHNVIIAIQSVIKAMDKLNIKYTNEENRENALFLSEIYVDYNSRHLTHLNEELVSAIKQLWFDSGVQMCYNRRNEYQLSDSAKYYFDSIDRLSAPDYVPTREDILRVRIPTTGVNEYTFELSPVHFRIIDVGGQRSERRKWIHCFENVTSIIFLTALNEYDRTHSEFDRNPVENRMVESQKLFQIITECDYFRKTSVILFLNKKDLFEEKIQLSNLVDYFPEYKGPTGDAMAAQKFILQMYLSMNPMSYRQIFSHFTCATDTENMRFVFKSVKHIILQNNIDEFLNLEEI